MLRRFAFLAVLFAFVIQVRGAELIGKVVRVSDGDTITVLDAGKVQHKIRLEGIDAPESKQAFGQQAKQALSDEIIGQAVKIVWEKPDKYGEPNPKPANAAHRVNDTDSATPTLAQHPGKRT